MATKIHDYVSILENLFREVSIRTIHLLDNRKTWGDATIW